jgi:hypothetical protein
MPEEIANVIEHRRGNTYSGKVHDQAQKPLEPVSMNRGQEGLVYLWVRAGVQLRLLVLIRP